MLCDTCKNDYPEADFFGKSACYHCIYKKKLELLESQKVGKRCIKCSKIVPKGRTKYCSKKCMMIIKFEKQSTHWTRVIQIDKLEFNAG